MGADTLSDVLRAVRLTGAVFVDVDVTVPWSAWASHASKLLPVIMPGAQHLISYHLVTEGECFAVPEGGAAIRLQAGDVIVFPHGNAHALSSDARLPRGQGFDVHRVKPTAQWPHRIHGGGGGERVKVICGFLGCDVRPFNPLLAALPREIHVNGHDSSSNARLAQFYQMAVAESREQRIGSESVLAKLSELMFIEVVRRYLERLPAEQTGWLAGLRDRHVGHALSLLHGQPAREWTLDDLAKEVALSRSALAERFTLFVGLPPIQYLAKWRMQMAAGLLTDGQASIAKVAVEVGYDSEAAFSRAFKKIVGVPPATWRKKRAEPVAAAAS